MVTLNDSTLRQNVYETIYDAIKSIVWSGSLSVTVTAAFIDDDQSFPQVVVHPANIDYTNFTFNRSVSDKNIVIVVDVYTKKNKDCDIISDNIMNAIEGLSTPGMMLVDTSEDRDTADIEGLKIHNKMIALTYKRNG
jgi:hypothetical protein